MKPDDSTIKPDTISYSQAQIDSLLSQHFINKIDHHLRIISSIRIVNLATSSEPNVILNIDIYYDNHQSGSLSFNLHNYEYEEILAIAKDIRANEYILHEVDNFLSGDVVE
jgi:hypothetical protein